MHKGFLKTAAILGALAVMLGAFAAHALKGMVSDKALFTFETAVRYQFYHVVALAFTAIFYSTLHRKTIQWAGRFFIIGILLFSGSLYILSAMDAMVKPGLKWVGAITPLGGICFILGWVLLFIAATRKQEV